MSALLSLSLSLSLSPSINALIPLFSECTMPGFTNSTLFLASRHLYCIQTLVYLVEAFKMQ